MKHPAPRAAGAFVLAAAATLAACSVPSNTFIAPEPDDCQGDVVVDGPLRVATYNIKAGLESSLPEIAAVLADLDADVIALQEVDRDAERTGRVDQARFLAEQLGMDYAYAATKQRSTGDFGVALLSRLPFVHTERIDLPSAFSFEPRVALAADLCAGDETVRVFSSHIDLNPVAALAQHEALSALAAPFVGQGVIVAGDLNATVDDAGLLALLATPLSDVGALDDVPTCDGRRIDFLLADAAIATRAVEAMVISTDASDHFPVVADLAW